jgi:desulfoferrodoxin (superoxide reductase-like protein)
MKYKIYLSVLLVVALATQIISFSSSAHPPQDMKLVYNLETNILNVTITHNSPAPNIHYIKKVEIRKNGELYLEEEYDSQPTTSTFTYSYFVEAEIGDELEVTAYCNINGQITRSLIITDEPIVVIVNPQKGFYLMNSKILPMPITLIVGAIDIQVTANDLDGIERVEFYIDDELKGEDTTMPYSLMWEQKVFLRHTISVKAFDGAGKTSSDETVVWKFF